MKDFVDAMVDYFKTQHPVLDIGYQQCGDWWFINCADPVKEWRYACIDVSAECIILRRGNYYEFPKKVVLPWELPDLFDIIDAELALVAQLAERRTLNR
jgi:hypothetical protein